MEVIARKLMNEKDYYVLFVKYTKRTVRKTEGHTRFYWYVSEDNSDLIAKGDLKSVTGLALMITQSLECKSWGEYMVFEYDGEELFPVFPRKWLEWAYQQEEYKPYLATPKKN